MCYMDLCCDSVPCAAAAAAYTHVAWKILVYLQAHSSTKQSLASSNWISPVSFYSENQKGAANALMGALELDPASKEISFSLQPFMQCTILLKKEYLSLQALILDDTCREATRALTSAANSEEQHNP